MMQVDIALAVQELVPNADYGLATTYDDLVRTWRDLRPVPTPEALSAAWAQREARRNAGEQARQRARVIGQSLENQFLAIDPSKPLNANDADVALRYLVAQAQTTLRHSG